MLRYLLALIVLISCVFSLNAQSGTAKVTGIITDAVSGDPVELVTVYVKGTSNATESSQNGRYSLSVPANKSFEIVFSRIGYTEVSSEVKPIPAQRSRQVDVFMALADSGLEVVVRQSKIEDSGLVREDVSQLKLLPTTTGNLESVLPHIALGTNSGAGGELSSQYNVRGGNYDENLVYVNDFEIYRPQLIRAGQQEGLTFANVDLIRDLTFSSGGFESRFGDKLSSVLDIKYKRPDSLRASAGLSFLGGSAHVEGSKKLGGSDYRRFRYLVGARYKTTRYLLGTLDIDGEYQPNFTDIQAYLTYDLNYNWQLGLMGNFNRSVFQFTPRSRTTGLGLINFALQLFSVFEGQEVDDFTTSMGGLSLTYLPKRDHNPFYLKFLTSAFQSLENERIDIIGRYNLSEIDTGLGSQSFGDVVAELGTGTQHQYVRNALDIDIYNLEHKGGLELQLYPDDIETTASHFLQWGAKFQHEQMNDWLNEWERLDSAGYSLNYDTNQVQLISVLKTRNNIQVNKFSAYVQNTFSWRKESVAEIKASAGVRANYRDINGEFIISPRAQLLYKPLGIQRDVAFRLAGGLYVQPPFYREMRGFDGEVNTDLLAQKSAHILGGMTLDFYLGRNYPKKFKLITEVYYKKLWDLVSYEIDNVRIRYSGQNDATGYVTGIDLRLNGEFVPGAESWINFSLLRARESLTGIQHMQREIGQADTTFVKDVPRPTDRLFNISMFFQDYLRDNKNFKVHFNLNVGSGLPFGLKDNNLNFRNTYRMSAYHRVDIGFSYALWDEFKKVKKPNHFLRFTRSTWVSLEVFNLLQVQNQASNTWIKTVFKTQYAIPNYLTSRRINLRLKMDF
jgi:hypothetical protein